MSSNPSDARPGAQLEPRLEPGAAVPDHGRQRRLVDELVHAVDDGPRLELILSDLDVSDLRAVAGDLAREVAREVAQHRVDGVVSPDEPSVSEQVGAPISAEQICERACEVSAQVFATTPERVMSDARTREVSDARAVAMLVSKRAGLGVNAIASGFGKDHASVIHATRRAEARPRLAAAAAGVGEHVYGRYATNPNTPDRPVHSDVARAGYGRDRPSDLIPDRRPPISSPVSAPDSSPHAVDPADASRTTTTSPAAATMASR